jgi:F-type H+-transporting ATPase subunit delta
MARTGFGKRYAQAAFELALENNALEAWQEGLKKLAGLTADEELMALLESPRLPSEAKKALLQERFGKVDPLAFNLALLMVHKGALRLSANIFQHFNKLLDDHLGVERAKVIAAVPLGEEYKETISSRLGQIVDRKVAVETEVDSSIIGGLIARIGDMLIDGSIRQRLETLKKHLVEAGR